MVAAVMVASLPLVLGTALGLLPRRLPSLPPWAVRSIGAAVLALIAGLLVVPAVREGGWRVLLGFAGALAAPAALERWPRAHRHSGHGARVELAFAGLVAHQVLEGTAIGAASAVPGPPVVALLAAGHTVPLVAIAVYGFSAHDGPRSALRRGALLVGVTAAASAAGAGLVGWSPGGEPWVQAVLAGLLLHLLGHLPRAGPGAAPDRVA
jgi:hypothetical protein